MVRVFFFPPLLCFLADDSWCESFAVLDYSILTVTEQWIPERTGIHTTGLANEAFDVPVHVGSERGSCPACVPPRVTFSILNSGVVGSCWWPGRGCVPGLWM